MNAYTTPPRPLRHAACAATAALLLAGCTTLAPSYEAPAMPVPQQYAQAAEAGGAQAAVSHWRDYFTDPALQAVIAQALAHNRNLRLATLRVAEARAACLAAARFVFHVERFRCAAHGIGVHAHAAVDDGDHRVAVQLGLNEPDFGIVRGSLCGVIDEVIKQR